MPKRPKLTKIEGTDLKWRAVILNCDRFSKFQKLIVKIW